MPSISSSAASVSSGADSIRAEPPPDAPPSHVERLRVRYSDSDAQGIAHHSSFFRWLEEARISWLRELGQPYESLNARDVFIPVVDAACSFVAPARPGDLVEIRLWPTHASRARLQFQYEVVRSDELLATAATTHAFVGADGRVRRLERDDPLWRALFAPTGIR